MKKKCTIVAAFVLAIVCAFAFAACDSGAKSAYDIAVENGFTGTQQEWLDSLKGNDGAAGTPGENGAAGTQWLRGTAAPDESVRANEGDYYLNTVSSNLYRKEGNAWVLVTNLEGESAVSVWDGTIPGWQNPKLSPEEIIKNRPAAYVVDNAAKTVQIYNAEAFAWFAYRSVIGLNGYEGWTVSLKCDIDLNNQMWVPIGLGARSNAAGTAFKGTFDGEGHTVYNLSSKKFYDGIRYGEFENLLSDKDDQTETGWYVNVQNHYLGNDVNVDVALQLKADSAADEFSFGLFGSTYGATVKNLHLVNTQIDLAKKTVNAGTDLARSCIGDSTGAIVGFAQYNLTVENCTVGKEGCDHAITGAKCAGGLVGRFYGGKEGDGKVQDAPDKYGALVIKNCVNYLNVGKVGIDKKGGIIGFPGYFSSVTITNCVNYGEIVGIYAGGMIGFRGNGTNIARGAVTLTDCANYGKITGTHAGGILGERHHTGGSGSTPFFIFRNCNNFGDIVGKQFDKTTTVMIGGLAGQMNISIASGLVLDCFNYGNVSFAESEETVNTSITEVYAGGMFGYFVVGTSTKFVISGGSSGTVTVTTTTSIDTNKLKAGICFGTTPAAERLQLPYGEVIAAGTATLNGTAV